MYSSSKNKIKIMAALPLKIARTCSHFGNNNRHNARTCADHTVNNNNFIVKPSHTKTGDNNTVSNNGVMLFGVRLMPSIESSVSARESSSSSSSFSSFRKCMSMNNLNQYEHQQQQQLQGQNCHFSTGDVGGGVGYASDDTLHGSGGRNRERKRGTPWTEEEHRLFLMGLNQVGKGDWRGISRNFVKTRTPTQVASHAQKYFLRRTNIKRRRRRSSLFDITTDFMNRSLSADQLNDLDTTFQPKPSTNAPTIFSSPCPSNSIPFLSSVAVTSPPITMPPSLRTVNLNLNQSTTSQIMPTANTKNKKEFEPFLSLTLSQSPSNEESSRPSDSFGGINGNGDNVISVA